MNRGALIGLAMLVALVIVSVTEVALSPSHAHTQPTWWVLLILATIVFSDGASEPVPDGADVSAAEGAGRHRV